MTCCRVWLTGLQNKFELRRAAAKSTGIQAAIAQKNGDRSTQVEDGGPFINLRAEFKLLRGHEATGAKHAAHLVGEGPAVVVIQIHHVQRMLSEVVEQATVIKVDSHVAFVSKQPMQTEQAVEGRLNLTHR